MKEKNLKILLLFINQRKHETESKKQNVQDETVQQLIMIDGLNAKIVDLQKKKQQKSKTNCTRHLSMAFTRIIDIFFCKVLGPKMMMNDEQNVLIQEIR